MKVQEFLIRAFMSVVISGFCSVLTVPLVGTLTGGTGSERFIYGVIALGAIVLFFTPWTKDTAADWVKDQASKNAQRKIDEQKHKEWTEQQRAKIAENRKGHN